MVDMIVFDMAGTTVNEHNLVYKTVQKAIERAGYEVTLQQVLAIAAGKEKSKAIRDCLVAIGAKNDLDNKTQLIHRDFKKRLAEAYHTEPVTPQPGAIPLFEQLQNDDIQVVINTGYDRSTADLLLERLDWKNSPLINLVVTASEVKRGRPYPDMILLAMEKLNCASPARVVKIGDSVIDIEEGQQAGCHCNVGITTGAQTRQQLEKANPTGVIDHLNELLPLLQAQNCFD